MTSRFARLSLAGLLLVLVSAVRAQAPATPPPQDQPAPLPAPAAQPAAPVAQPAAQSPQAAPEAAAPADDALVTLKLPDADIDTILSTLENLTGKIILRPSQLPTAPGGYNLKITKPIPKSQAVLYLETVLAMNQIAVIPLGKDALKVVQLTNARIEAPELIMDTTLSMRPSGKVASKLFQLDFLRVQEFQAMLQTLANPNFGQMVPLANANAILITDTISNLQRIETLMQQVDKPVMAGMAPKFYTLRYAKASDMVSKLRSILTGTIQQQLGQVTTYNADDRTNQIILITDSRQFAFFDDLIAKLDVKSDPNTRNEVIYLRHAKAEDVATVLVKIIQGQSTVTQRSQSARPAQAPTQPAGPMPPSPLGAPGAPAAPTIVSGSAAPSPGGEGLTSEFSSLVTVVNDERSNAVIVSGTMDDIRLMKELIDKLDIVLAQVRIEVVIAEVTLDNNHDSGISQLGLMLDGDKLVGFSGTGPGFGIAGPDGTGSAAITRPGGTVAVSGHWDLAGTIALNTTRRKNNTTILTVPAIVTSHGKKAVINDGETRPIITGVTSFANSSTAGTTSSQITQQQIGTTLTVTPFIGNDNTIQLDIEQELTDVIDTVSVDQNTQYVIGTRKATSYVTAKSGEIHVLGGFRKKIDSRQTNRLGPIPIIGDLLGRRTKDKYHQELIFFLRPMVLDQDDSARNIAETMQTVDKLPTRDEIKGQLNPNYQPPKQSVLDRILPK